MSCGIFQVLGFRNIVGAMWSFPALGFEGILKDLVLEAPQQDNGINSSFVK